MRLRLTFTIVVLVLLTACSSSGYNRSYITDTIEQTIVSEASETR